MGPVVQSYKKVLDDAPTSRASSTKFALNLVKGVDSAPAGQTGPIDADVPTGSVVKYIEIAFSWTNIASVQTIVWSSIQLLHSGQSSISPRLVGGDPQRNQVFHQSMSQIGEQQNSNHIYRFKIPRKFQRVRDGDVWQFVYEANAVFASVIQVHYKFYR